MYYISEVINIQYVMRGYLTKTQKRWTLTIRDNNNVPHRYKISNFKKFCKNVLHSTPTKIRKERSIGQYIVDKLGFSEMELWMLDEMMFTFP